MGCIKDDTSVDWKMEALRNCAELGELKIAIGERLEKYRTEYATLKGIAMSKESNLERIAIEYKMKNLKEQIDWLEERLYGTKTE